jgi:ribosomal protein S27E
MMVAGLATIPASASDGVIYSVPSFAGLELADNGQYVNGNGIQRMNWNNDAFGDFRGTVMTITDGALVVTGGGGAKGFQITRDYAHDIMFQGVTGKEYKMVIEASAVSAAGVINLVPDNHPAGVAKTFDLPTAKTTFEIQWTQVEHQHNNMQISSTVDFRVYSIIIYDVALMPAVADDEDDDDEDDAPAAPTGPYRMKLDSSHWHLRPDNDGIIIQADGSEAGEVSNDISPEKLTTAVSVILIANPSDTQMNIEFFWGGPIGSGNTWWQQGNSQVLDWVFADGEITLNLSGLPNRADFLRNAASDTGLNLYIMTWNGSFPTLNVTDVYLLFPGADAPAAPPVVAPPPVVVDDIIDDDDDFWFDDDDFWFDDDDFWFDDDEYVDDDEVYVAPANVNARTTLTLKCGDCNHVADYAMRAAASATACANCGHVGLVVSGAVVAGGTDDGLNPKTGVAVVIVPTLTAAAALIVARRRK